MKRAIAILFILSLIATSCKKKDDESPTAPKTTLAERAGTYEAIHENILLNMEMEIKIDGSVYIGGAGSSFNKLDPMSTATYFSIVSVDGQTTFTLDFSTGKLTGLTGTYAGGIYTISKK